MPGSVLKVCAPDRRTHAGSRSGLLRLKEIVDHLLSHGRGDLPVGDQLRQLAHVALGEVVTAFDWVRLLR